MQRDSKLAIQRIDSGPRSIFSVPDDRQTPSRELNAKLVASAGPGPQLELGTARPLLQHAERDPRFLPPGTSLRNDPGAVDLAGLFHRTHSLPLLPGRP